MNNLSARNALAKIMGLVLMATVAGSIAHADLGDTMKAMNNDLKTIAAQVNDTSKNTKSAALADDFAKTAETAKSFVADSIAQAPAAQQAAMKAQYDALIDQSVILGQQLAAALRAGNTAQAKTLLTQLAALKSQGHTQFKK